MDSLRRVIGLVLAMACFVGVSTRSTAFVPPGHNHELPDFDKRREGKTPSPLPEVRAAAADKIKRAHPSVWIERDPWSHSAKHVFATRGFLTGPKGEGKTVPPGRARAFAAEDQHRGVKGFLDENAPLFGHGSEVLNNARVKRDAVARNKRFRTFVWEQRLDDIRVHEGVLVANVTGEGELINLSSYFVAEPERAADAGTPKRAALQNQPQVSAAQAVLLAAENLEEELGPADLVALDLQPQGKEKAQRFKAGPLPGEAVVYLAWLPMDASSLRLCWNVELTRRAGGERYRLLIDALDGSVQVRTRLTVYLTDASFRVFTSDSPTAFSPGWPAPNSAQPPLQSRSLVTLSALSTNASPIGWISDGENETRGNNVDAHSDHNADDLPDLPRPRGTPFRVFDMPLDLTQVPSAYSDAATVQLFYWCNWAHDRLYELGFDEASGNFQKDNFGRGGQGNDAIIADAQDGSGFNNANFTPTADGVPGRIQMFIWDSPTPAIDGDFDAEVVLHEYVHGLSTRLVGGGVGIGTLQAAGMGEGWSDFYAMALLSEPGDDVDASYAFGGYASQMVNGLTENYYFGIRRYPYSTDLTRNPLTFKDIDSAQISPHAGVPMNPIFTFNPIDAPEVHFQGEVWCVMLWEARANLIRKHGYEVGNPLILQLVTDGMKLSPPNPTFTQARDAILLADQVNNGGANYGDLWAAFAKRGLGFGAAALDTTITAGIVEAYDLPDSLFISNPTQFVSGGPLGGPLFPACQSYPITNISEEAISWTVRVSQPWLSVTPSGGTLAPGQAIDVQVCVTEAARALPLGTYSDSIVFSNSVTRVVQTRGAQVRIVSFTSMPFSDDFENGLLKPHWSVSGVGGYSAQVTHLNGPRGGHHVTLDSASGTKARNELTLGIDLGGFTNVVLKFWAKSFSDEPDGPPSSPFLVGADFDGVAVSEDGVTWYEVQGLRDVPSSYTQFTVDLDSAIAVKGLRYNSTFRIRFNQVDDFQIPFDGLTIDDISITGQGVRRLTVELPKQGTEGSGRLPEPGVVMLGSTPDIDVLVNLVSSDSTRVRVPSTVLIPAGTNRATFSVTLLDNSALEGTVEVTVEAVAAGYFGSQDVIRVSDNELAELKVNLPPRIREGDVHPVKHGTVRLSSKPERDVIVRLESGDPSELSVPAQVVIPAGKHSADFEIVAIDDNRIDGTRAVIVTARVDSWQAGSDTTLVQDNDEPALVVELPGAASEANGVLTNAGKVRLSGTLTTNITVALQSSDLTELRVPASVVVPAGELESVFDLSLVNDAVVDGGQKVTVTARVPAFTSGVATMTVLDDETPPVPFAPQPADRATNAPVSLVLSWHPGEGEVLVNGGFETGNFFGWVTVNTGYGLWVINDGKFDPDGPDVASPPLSGKFNAMITQFGGGTHLLYQDVFIPNDASEATLAWSDKIRNHTPYYAPNQSFRVEIRDTNNAVLAVLFSTKDGDPLLNDWKRRSADLSGFRGRTIRIAFAEEDSTGYFNVHVDDVSLKLGTPAALTSFEVYFGTTATLGSAQRVGSTTNVFWPLPRLSLNTQYFWQVVAKRGEAVTRGPVWRFTTRGTGPVHHFEWGPIASPQFVGERFPITVVAKDDINNTVKDFTGPVTLTGLAGGVNRSQVVISEVDISVTDSVEFVNVSTRAIDLSGWKVSVYDASSWPSPLTTVVIPNGSICPAGGLFVLNDQGEAPGIFPQLNAGTNINWNLGAIGNPIAVLLRDSRGEVVDFLAAGNADPTLITLPSRIPSTEWNGKPVVAALPQVSLSLQRAGNADRNDSSDWTAAVATFGFPNAILQKPFPRTSTVALTPSVLTNFTTGVWSGYLTVHDLVPSVNLEAEDGDGSFGFANEFTMGAREDIGVSVNDSPDVAMLGEPLLYQVTVTNSGPGKATGVVLTNILPAEVNFISAQTFHGVCGNEGRLVICQLNDLSAENRAIVNITTRAAAPGVVTNLARVIRAERENYTANDFARAITTITGPSISITNVNIVEVNSTSIARFPVHLSARCTLPVSVTYKTENSTAMGGQDFQPVEGTLVFGPGVTNLTIEVPVLGDLLDEITETFFVNLSAPTNGQIVVSQGRCRITDNDPQPNLSITDVSLPEGRTGETNHASFELRMSAPSGMNTAVSFATTDRTAAAPADYLTTFGTITFLPGETNYTIRVPVRGDNRFEPDETFSVRLFNAAFLSLPRSEATATITDDDAGEVDRFVWDNVPAPQVVGVPFPGTLTALDGLNRTATGFNGTVNVRGIADSRQITVGTETTPWSFPLGSLFHDVRMQVIYLPSELGGSGNINALALDLTSLPGQVLSNWTIRLKHSDSTSFLQPAWQSDWTTVYRRDETIPSPGWVTFLFDTPFAYNGAQPLLVDFSFNNATYSVNGLVRSTAVSQRRSVFLQTDSAFGDPLSWSGTFPPGAMTNRVPNVRFLTESPVDIVPSGPVQVVAGIWTGPVTVRQPGTNIFLRASDDLGHIANGNEFVVLASAPSGIGGSVTEVDTPVIRAVRFQGREVAIRFSTVVGTAYQLERAESLVAPNWVPVGDGVTGNGSEFEWIDRNPPGSGRAFYRVRVIR